MTTPRSPSDGPSISMRSTLSEVCDDDDVTWENSAVKVPEYFQFEKDLYTSTFLFVLRLSGTDLNKSAHGPVVHLCGSFFTPCICLGFVVFIQVFALVGVADFVSTSWDLSLGGYDFALHDYSYTNHTIQIGNSQPLCGQFEQFEFNEKFKMPDGTMYMASDENPISVAYKMPGGSWDSSTIVNEKSMLDESLLAVSDDFRTKPHLIKTDDAVRNALTAGGLHSWNSGSVYWVYHYLMSMLLAFVLIVEIRKIAGFSLMLHHFYKSGSIVKWGEVCCAYDQMSGQLSICALTEGAFAAGIGVIVLRTYVVVCFGAASYWLFLLTMSRMELIFNALALSFILEIDDLVYWAIMSHFAMKMVEDLKRVEITSRKFFGSVALHNILTPLTFFVASCIYSISCRYGQLYMRKKYFAAIASVCLFYGPTPEVTSQPIVAPVPGFCESLLQTACAANVTGPASEHGPCYIADARNASVKISSMDEPFEDMFDASGARRSWIEWGAPKRELLETGWDSLKHSQRNVLRKVCLQMYQPAATVDTRTIDDDSEEVMNGGPFFCLSSVMYPEIVPKPGNATNIWDLTEKNLVRAVDRCRLSPGHPALEEYSRLKIQNTQKNSQKTQRTGKGSGGQKSKKQTEKGQQAVQAFALGSSKTVQMLNNRRKRRSHHHHTLSTGKVAFLGRLWSN